MYVRLTETGLIYQVYIAAVPQALGRGKTRPCPAQFDKGQPEGGKTANGQNFIPCGEVKENLEAVSFDGVSLVKIGCPIF